ncbi:hypothetical protein [Sinimarinibacterium sp. NLF-5-8]|uniref:hypothetical protein n=1 Tax=Sinimarinibacterium sp. NLF-5-8 TaxID=2698684 RepID=UPI00137BE0D4|nr:hypothetical protein [Sinimarinibacterium sp. NLF-5-8]QHS08987.1 hypothetical protein GT972_01750 [Sinimarinibacterium sp. NLF-5-8]
MFGQEYISVLSGTPKLVRRWQADQGVSDALIGLMIQPMPQGFGWTQARASSQMADLQEQVWFLYLQARGDVPPEDIWAQMVEDLLKVLHKTGDRAEGRGFDPERSIAAYVTFSVARKLPRMIGASASVSGAPRGEADAIARRVAVSATVSLSDGEAIDAVEASIDPVWGGGAHLGLQSPEAALMSDELNNTMFSYFDELEQYVPVLACRIRGMAVADYPRFREERRRAFFEKRWIETGEAIPRIFDQPKSERLLERHANNRPMQGRKLRVRALRAGMAAWRKSGRRFCLERQKVLEAAVETWTGGAPKTLEAMRESWTAQMMAVCDGGARQCPRCSGGVIGPKAAKPSGKVELPAPRVGPPQGGSAVEAW